MTSSTEVAAAILGDSAEAHVPIGPMTTYRVGGPAALFMRIANKADMALAKTAVCESGISVLVIGKGSNLLISDAGFEGLVIQLGGEYTQIDLESVSNVGESSSDGIGVCIVRAGGGVSLPVLARRTAGVGLRGLEWAVGVPGSVGGALRMNAGGHGSQTAEILHRYEFADLSCDDDGIRPAVALDLRYRHSSLSQYQVVLWAEFELRRGSKEDAEVEIAEIVRWRREHQPGGRNAGSVFTNPDNSSAGGLIDRAGLKGFTVRSAAVSDKHANFVQSESDGSGDDVLALIHEVRRRVFEATGVMLEPELRLVGFTEDQLQDLAGSEAAAIRDERRLSDQPASVGDKDENKESGWVP